jgi:hypothetical protein
VAQGPGLRSTSLFSSGFGDGHDGPGGTSLVDSFLTGAPSAMCQPCLLNFAASGAGGGADYRAGPCQPARCAGGRGASEHAPVYLASPCYLLVAAARLSASEALTPGRPRRSPGARAAGAGERRLRARGRGETRPSPCYLLESTHLLVAAALSASEVPTPGRGNCA